METPRIGVGLPIIGPHASADSLTLICTEAERLGFHSVSTSDRLLLPAAEGWENWAGLPEHPAYDAIESLIWAAGVTSRVRLITGVVNSIFQPPVLLARRLATLDVLSGGRVDAGLGQGWMPEEFEASGVPMSFRGAGFEEHLAVMRACWAEDPVEAGGPRYPVPRARIGPKPAGGRIPVLIGGVTRASVARSAHLGDGFLAAFRDWDGLTEHINWYRDAGGTGQIVMRAGPLVADADNRDQAPFGAAVSMMGDLERARGLGVDELIWDLNIIFLPPEQQVEELRTLARLLDL
jgi:probable F420-dependent oxidoreductase